MRERHICEGLRTSGYWKGYPCAAIAKYQKYGRWWCKNHFPFRDEDNHQKERKTNDET